MSPTPPPVKPPRRCRATRNRTESPAHSPSASSCRQPGLPADAGEDQLTFVFSNHQATCQVTLGSAEPSLIVYPHAFFKGRH